MNYYSIDKNIQDIDINVIRLSCSIQLKVLLVAIKENFKEKFNSEQISAELKKDIADVEEAIEFWVNLKIIKIINKSPKNISKSDKKKDEKSSQKISKDHITKRIQSDEEINYLLNAIETAVGRPLSGTDVSVILNLKDGEGMPCNVILMLIRYCVQIGKAATRYIEKVGIDWARNGIDTVELAEKKIQLLNNSKKIWKKFEKIAGIPDRAPTKKEEETIFRWFNEWNFSESMITEAYEKCVNKKGAYILSYMDGIVKKWHTQNIKKLSDLNNSKKNSNKKKDIDRPSYDLEKYESFNIFE
jgi:DnaD/phage-associated family protein